MTFTFIRVNIKSKLSFVYLIENLLEEDMNSPFALSLVEYGFGHDMTIFYGMSLEDIDNLSYTDTSFIKHNLYTSYKKLAIGTH